MATVAPKRPPKGALDICEARPYTGIALNDMPQALKRLHHWPTMFIKRAIPTALADHDAARGIFNLMAPIVEQPARSIFKNGDRALDGMTATEKVVNVSAAHEDDTLIQSEPKSLPSSQSNRSA